jgi:hypothetical protein
MSRYGNRAKDVKDFCGRDDRKPHCGEEAVTAIVRIEC